MKLGIIGLGVVGSAIRQGLEELGHSIKEHDIKYKTSVKNIMNSEVCFICVPTPSKQNGECDTSIVESVVKDLNNFQYPGIVAIKSTVVPGTTEKLKKEYPDLEICFVPEFLRERCAVADFTDNHDLCVIGTEDADVFRKIKKCHGHYPVKYIQLNPTEAEMCKYFNNIYNATLITFANSFYEICEVLGIDYSRVKAATTERTHICNKYLDCNKNLRGFGGVCLPKDTKAIAALVKSINLDVDFFETLLSENSKYKKTIYEGMREQ